MNNVFVVDDDDVYIYKFKLQIQILILNDMLCNMLYDSISYTVLIYIE